MKLAAAAALALALLLPGPAGAEAVPGTLAATDARLAVAPDGTPRVLAVAAGRLLLAARGPDGSWATDAAPPLPSAQALVTGAAVSPAGRLYALAEDDQGRWLVLEERGPAGWRPHVLVRSPARQGSLGIAGLALDRAGRPVVAYAVAYPGRKTALRLVRPDRRGRYVARGITKGGFPPSDEPPSAAPVVLPGGGVRVVETFTGAAIEWAPKGRTWEGQFLSASALGSPSGPAAAAPALPGVWSAWTELYPTANESHVLLTLHRDGEQTTILDRHSYLVDLVVGADGPEVAANDYVDGSVLGGDPSAFVYAGLVLAASGLRLELEGRIVGYAAEPGGGRQLLLEGADGLDWYRAPSLPAVRVSLTATPAPGGTITLAGRVDGGAGGSVELYRERPGEAPVLAATAPLAPDGSFTAADPSPAAPTLYRAVYRLEPGGLPFAALLRTPASG